MGITESTAVDEPQEYQVRDGIWDVHVRVVKIMARRHAIEIDGDANSLAYCNNCGELFVLENSTTHKSYCAHCHWEQIDD